MKVTITIDTENAAFENNLNLELSEILRRLTVWLSGRAPIQPGDHASIFDTNGNHVGLLEMSE